MFHHFHGDDHTPGQGSILADDFEKIIKSYGSRILSSEEWISRVVSGKLKSEDVCITFDDTLACQVDLALPILEKYDLTAFWFVYTSVFEGELELLEILRRFRHEAFPSIVEFYVEFENAVDSGEFADLKEELISGYDHLNWAAYPFYTSGDTRFRYIRDEILGKNNYEKVMMEMISKSGFSVAQLAEGLWMSREALKGLADTGHSIGLHTHRHPTTLTKLSYEEQVEEFGLNLKSITDICGMPPRTVAYPCNSYNADTLRLMQEMDIEVGFRANMRLGLGDDLELPREDHANILQKLGI
ncbi:polysaccharide deacetylase family protein [bacterium]|nr:polysaccharide deacetylase family protein [bacterium]